MMEQRKEVDGERAPAEPRRIRPVRAREAGEHLSAEHELPRDVEEQRTMEVREERLVPHKQMREAGEVVIRKRVETVPGRLEVDASVEEVEVEHVPVGRVVSERREPWEEDGCQVVPVYEEQLVVTKRLVLREQLRIRRTAASEKRLFEDSLQRERVTIEDSTGQGRVRERYPTDDAGPDAVGAEHSESFLERLRRSLGF